MIPLTLAWALAGSSPLGSPKWCKVIFISLDLLVGAVTIWPGASPQAPIYSKNQTEYFPIFSFFTIPFDFSKRRKEERNWILAGNFDQEMGACFLREKKYSLQKRKLTKKSEQYHSLDWQHWRSSPKQKSHPHKRSLF